MVVIVPNTVRILLDQNICIRDFSAFTPIIMYYDGMVDMHSGRDNQSVMVGSGKIVKDREIRNSTGVICTKEGTEVGSGMIHEIIF